jgi:ribosomal-protein-alanine N-acetyltransferase
MALHGPTLTLRPPTEADAPALLELAADPEVTRWFSWGPYCSLEEPLAYVERCARQRETGEQLDLLVVHRDLGPAGITGLSEFSHRDGRAMVGTWFGRRFWGTGANRESKAIVFRLGFDLLALNRIGSYSNPENVRSTRALLGVGLRQEGLLRAWHRHGDRYLDVNVFGLLRDEWAAGDLAAVDVRVDGAVPEAFVATRPDAPPARGRAAARRPRA